VFLVFACGHDLIRFFYYLVCPCFYWSACIVVINSNRKENPPRHKFTKSPFQNMKNLRISDRDRNSGPHSVLDPSPGKSFYIFKNCVAVISILILVLQALLSTTHIHYVNELYSL
jgi:hypothetical protein